MDIKFKVGLRIKELRKKLGLTQEALAYKAAMDKTYVNEVENGKRNISIINMEKLVFALEINMQDFFTNEIFQTKR